MSPALQPCLSTCGPPRPTRTSALVLAVILAAGCQSDGISSPDPFSADPWTVSGPEVRIGSVDDPDYVFGPVVGLTPSPDGFLYSLHWGDATIRRWTPDGTPAGSVGRQGEGPGEFERPIRMGFHGDSLWVWDLDAYRVNYFDLEGEFVGSVSPKVEIGGPESSPPRPESPLRDGTFVGQVPAWSDGIARGTLTETPYVHMDGAGETLGRIWAKPHEPRDVFAILNKSGFGGSYSSQPFGDGYMATILEDGLLVLERRAWTGEGDPTVRVSKIGLGGDTLFTAAVPYRTHTDARRAFRLRGSGPDRAEGFHVQCVPGLGSRYPRCTLPAIPSPRGKRDAGGRGRQHLAVSASIRSSRRRVRRSRSGGFSTGKAIRSPGR